MVEPVNVDTMTEPEAAFLRDGCGIGVDFRPIDAVVPRDQRVADMQKRLDAAAAIVTCAAARGLDLPPAESIALARRCLKVAPLVRVLDVNLHQHLVNNDRLSKDPPK